MSGNKIKALALFSGGLDSIVSCRVIMAQGIEVVAVRYVTPFFGYELLAREEEYAEEMRGKYGINVILRDLSEKYLKMLRNPAHGYGKNFNPCVDCKILIASETKALMEELSASFIISGEVLGQRPMSQRRDTLRIIERDSGCHDILLRPLSAKNMTETLPERNGLVDRSSLYGFSGRSRFSQKELAASLGISDYPTPAGGCVLTEPTLACRIAAYYENNKEASVSDIRLLLTGRQFHLPGGGWMIMGRDHDENMKILSLAEPSDIILKMVEWPGPSAVLRNSVSRQDVLTAAGLLMRYSKKGAGRSGTGISVEKIAVVERETGAEILKVEPLSDEMYQQVLNGQPF